MDLLPITPKTNVEPFPDFESIVQKEFQDLIAKQKISLEILTNFLTRVWQAEALTNFLRAVKSCRELESQLKDLSDGEKRLVKFKISYILSELDEKRPKGQEKNDSSSTPSSGRSYGCPVLLYKNDLFKDSETSSSQSKSNIFVYNKESRIDYWSDITSSSEKYPSTIFVAEPYVVTFKDYRKNVLYEEYFSLRNVTSRPQSFYLPHLNKISDFKITLMSPSQNIAPGMSGRVLVTFMASKFKDSVEDLNIRVSGGEYITVRLVSLRWAPTLKGLVYYNSDDVGKAEVEERDKDQVFNKTIDSGSCLLGSSLTIKFVVKNVGGDGSFFLMSEEDWVSYNVSDITEKFKLCMSDFTISPVYFKVNNDETEELTIKYKPSECGLSVDKFCILCDNNTLKEVDIIGDCQMFHMDVIKYEFGKVNGKSVKGADECNCLYFGNIYNHSKFEHHFSILNTSSLRIEYMWQIHENEPEPDKNIESIKENWISVSPVSGRFETYKRQEFQIQILMDAEKSGHYSCSLSLFVLNIPEESLPRHLHDNLDNGINTKSEINQNMWNIQLEQFEILVNNIPLQVEMYPCEIIYEFLDFNAESPQEIITVSNKGESKIHCEWICIKMSDDIEVTFTPRKFSLSAHFSVNISVKVTPLSYRKFDETYALLVNNYEKYELKIRGSVKQPSVFLVNKLLNFGIVRANSAQALPILLTNKQNFPLEWYSFEVNYDFENRRFVEISNTCLSQSWGKLKPQQICNIVYELNTTKPRKYLSIISFYTIYDQCNLQGAHVIITADIKEPLVRITDENYSEDIFKTKHAYTVYEEKSFEIFIHNDSLVDTTYRWGLPVGTHIDMALPSFDREYGTLAKSSRTPTRIIINFLKTGLIHDFYIPCFVEGLQKPVYLQICAKVKEFQCIVTIPSGDRYSDIYWPHETEELPENTYYSDQFESYHSESDRLSEESKQPVQIHESIDDYYKIRESENPLYKTKDVKKYIEEHKSEFESDVDIFSLGDSSAHTKTCQTKSYETVTNISSSLQSSFRQEYKIYFSDILCRQACKKSIYIRNVSKRPMKFRITPTNFHEDFKQIVNPYHDSLMIFKTKTLSHAKQFSSKLSEHGIVVESIPSSEEIQCDCSFKIDLWVYAETWGQYNEEVIIEVQELPPLCIYLDIKVTGQPIEYPIIIASEERNPKINFGTLSYNEIMEPLKRVVKIHNSSTIPYVIIWHLLKNNPDKYTKPSINVLYDFVGFESDGDDLNCKIRITKYFGIEDYDRNGPFQIEPRELYCEPHQTKEIFITFTPPEPDQDFETQNIEATIIGHIYTASQYRYNPNIYKRDPITDLKPTKIFLTSKLECTKFNFEYVRGRTCVHIAAEDVLRNVKKEELFYLYLTNSKTACTKVHSFVDEPFEIVSAQAVPSKKSDLKDLELCRDEYLKLTVKCTFTSRMIMDLADEFYGKRSHNFVDVRKTENNCMCFTRSLHIQQRCGVKQFLPLQAFVAFPNISVSPSKMDFKEVVIGGSEYMTLRLTNITNMETKFHISVNSKCVFRVEPNCGYLRPKMAENKSVYISIRFCPKSSIQYQDTLLIQTSFPQYSISVELRGEGICDVTNYNTEICPVKSKLVLPKLHLKRRR